MLLKTNIYIFLIPSFYPLWTYNMYRYCKQNWITHLFAFVIYYYLLINKCIDFFKESVLFLVPILSTQLIFWVINVYWIEKVPLQVSTCSKFFFTLSTRLIWLPRCFQACSTRFKSELWLKWLCKNLHFFIPKTFERSWKYT